MWKRIRTWFDEWNDELLGVLLDPKKANQIKVDWRHKIATRVTTLSEIERTQLHQFCLEYEGKKLWLSIVKLCTVFSCLGGILYLAKPQLHWMLAIAVANLLGWMLMFALIGIWFNYRQLARARFRLSLKAFGGVLLGFFGSSTLIALVQSKDVWSTIWQQGPLTLLVAAVFGAIYLVLIGIVAGWRNQGYEIIAAQLALVAEREKNARQESESQLRLLRAQIEPHFLFNTLGAVQQLATPNSPKAAELTANLIVFLRACMNEMRSDKIQLLEEFQLIQAYLEVMKARMGARLSFRLQLPENLQHIDVPSMMLLTLVENAIKHGIEPSLRGGDIIVEARQLGNEISIEVRDTGVGLSDIPSSGSGLQNVRDRLWLQYGEGAILTVSEVQTGGVIAEVKFPMVGLRGDR